MAEWHPITSFWSSSTWQALWAWLRVVEQTGEQFALHYEQVHLMVVQTLRRKRLLLSNPLYGYIELYSSTTESISISSSMARQVFNSILNIFPSFCTELGCTARVLTHSALKISEGSKWGDALSQQDDEHHHRTLISQRHVEMAQTCGSSGLNGAELSDFLPERVIQAFFEVCLIQKRCYSIPKLSILIWQPCKSIKLQFESFITH